MSERDRVMQRKRQLSDTARGWCGRTREVRETEASRAPWHVKLIFHVGAMSVFGVWSLQLRTFPGNLRQWKPKQRHFQVKHAKGQCGLAYDGFYVTTEAIPLCTSGIPPEMVSPLKNVNGKICRAEHKELKVLLRHLTCRKSNPTRGVTKKTSDAERAR